MGIGFEELGLEAIEKGDERDWARGRGGRRERRVEEVVCHAWPFL
jgi:hypothetical protein